MPESRSMMNVMRLGLLGPAEDHEAELERGAKKLRNDLGAQRVVYLGKDRSLDAVVRRWAVALVGDEADDDTLLRRATRECLLADPDTISSFLDKERERSELRMFESLVGEKTRSVELLLGKVAVMLYDKAYLEEEDILPATLLIFGKSDEPLIKRIGRRWFLSPGSFPKHGIMMVDDEEEELRATVYDQEGKEVGRQMLEAPKELRMRVSGS